MKYILILLLIISGTLCADLTTTGNEYFYSTPKQDTVAVNTYSSLDMSAGSGLTGSDVFDMLIRERQTRIRQYGTVKQIKMYVHTVVPDSLFVKIWRKSGSNYTLIGSSENISSELSTSTINTVTLTSPISNVQEGDYIGFTVYADSSDIENTVLSIGTTDTSETNKSYYTSSLSSSPVEWESVGTGYDYFCNIQCLMDAPDFICIGGSLAQGKTGNNSFISDDTAEDLDGTVEYWLSYYLGGYTYQNMGHGGDTTTDVLNRIQADCIDLSPRFCLIFSGGNDIRTGVPQETIFNNYVDIFDLCQTNDIPCILTKGAPHNNRTNEQWQTYDSLNVRIDTLVADYDGFLSVDFKPYLGQYRSGGDDGNLWDIIDVYSVGDGAHYTPAGYAIMGEAIYDKINSTTISVSGGIDINGLQSYWSLDKSDVKSTTVKDKSGNGNSAVCAESPAFSTDQNGVANQSIYFDGDQSIRITDFDPTGDSGKYLSCFSWVNVVTYGGNQPIFAQYDPDVDKRAIIMIIKNTGVFSTILSDDGTLDVGHGKKYDGTSNLFDTWHHVGFTWNNGTLKLYVDGEEITPAKEQDDAITTIYNPDIDIIIGARLSNGDVTLPLQDGGMISDVLLYNRVLTDDQISNIYNAGLNTGKFILN